MISIWRIFWLEWTALVRSKTLAILLTLAIGWMFAAPWLFRGDGTAAGARELTLHYSLGGVAALVAVALTAAAAGSLSRERFARRLQLTLVRPVSRFLVAWGRMLAILALGASVMGLASGVEYVRQARSAGGLRDCRHVLKPIMPSPREEAEDMYKVFMADPHTPVQVRKASRSRVLKLLTQRAMEHYQTVGTNRTIVWKFALGDSASAPTARFRFSNNYNLRDDVVGELVCGPYVAAVSNMTQSVLELPLVRVSDAAPGETTELAFHNRSRQSVMLRPRRDVELLVEADGFGWNLLRVWLELTGLVALVVSFGMFLGAGLGRPVALFTAIVTLALSVASPGIAEESGSDLNLSRTDAMALYLTRFAAAATQPLNSLRPLEALSLDECVEWDEVVRVLLADAVALPLVFAFLSALVMVRKQE